MTSLMFWCHAVKVVTYNFKPWNIPVILCRKKGKIWSFMFMWHNQLIKKSNLRLKNLVNKVTCINQIIRITREEISELDAELSRVGCPLLP